MRNLLEGEVGDLADENKDQKMDPEKVHLGSDRVQHDPQGMLSSLGFGRIHS